MTTHRLYGGDVELVFEKRGRKNGYWIGDESVVRVTSVGVPMPFAAACWYGAGLAKAKYLKLIDVCRDYSTSGDGVEVIEEDDGSQTVAIRIDELEQWAEALRKAAGDTTARDRGTEGHAIVESYLEHGEFPFVPKYLQFQISEWKKWWDAQEVQVHTTEKKVYSREYNYAGTMDLDATINGLRGVVDWKFGKIRASVKTQTAAYLAARAEEKNIHYDHRMVVSITDDGVKTEVFEDQDADFGAFLNLLEYHRWLK